MSRWYVVAGALSAALAVAAGAWAAHGLAALLPPAQLARFATAAEYQMYHALGLLAVGCYAATGRAGPGWGLAGAALLAGTLLFSGSLYAFALGGPRWLVWLTPLGGLTLLLGWTALAVSAWRAPAPA